MLFADDWIRTADLWCRKRPLYQLTPTLRVVFLQIFFCVFVCFDSLVSKLIKNDLLVDEQRCEQHIQLSLEDSKNIIFEN